jgi:hypothetical protein
MAKGLRQLACRRHCSRHAATSERSASRRRGGRTDELGLGGVAAQQSERRQRLLRHTCPPQRLAVSVENEWGGGRLQGGALAPCALVLLPEHEGVLVENAAAMTDGAREGRWRS